jgi:hypothetical protein
MDKIPKTYINSQEDSQDNRLRNTISLKDNALKLFESQRKMAVSSDCFYKIHSLQQQSKLSAKEADDLAEELLEDPLEENEEYTEADKIVQTKYNDVIKKQSSLLEEGDKVLSNSVTGVMDRPLTKYYIEEYNTHKKIREVLLSDRVILEQEDSQVNVLENKEENKSEGNVKDIESYSKESPKNKGKHKLDDDLDESTNKRSKEDEVDKGENLTDPVAKPSLIDDYANTSLEMPEHTAGDD